jgi:hypothetical protein
MMIASLSLSSIIRIFGMERIPQITIQYTIIHIQKEKGSVQKGRPDSIGVCRSSGA